MKKGKWVPTANHNPPPPEGVKRPAPPLGPPPVLPQIKNTIPAPKMKPPRLDIVQTAIETLKRVRAYAEKHYSDVGVSVSIILTNDDYGQRKDYEIAVCGEDEVYHAVFEEEAMLLDQVEQRIIEAIDKRQGCFWLKEKEE